MYCTMCGAHVEDGQRFCTKCGAPIEDVPDSTAHMPRVENDYPPQPSEKSSRQNPLVPVVIACAIVAIGAAALLTKGFGMFGSGQASQPTSTAAAEPQPTESPEEVAVQSTLEAYSWSDLSSIAKLMEEANSKGDATTIAKKYGLLNQDGSVSSSTKALKLSDGTTTSVRIAGIYHDDLADGSGKAGITFVTTQSIGTHAMQDTESNAGGWKSCSLRSWLSSEVLPTLPSDLRSMVAPVSKLTNNVGKTTSTSGVSATSDKIWLLSEKEVAGDISWDWASDSPNSGSYNAVINAEGTQYQLFAEKNINPEEGNAVLSLSDASAASTVWCLRSPSPSTADRFRHVDTDGNPSVAGLSSTDSFGVVLGFCL